MLRSPRLAAPRLASLLVLAVLSCKGGGCPTSGGSSGGGTGGGGAGTVDPPPPPPPPPDSDGADDTAGGGGADPVCLQEPVEGQSRTRRQCAGDLDAVLTLDVTVAGFSVDQDPVPITKDFGNGQADDEYADPLVMACCAEVADPFCSSGASQSCYLDLIQTSCQSLPVRVGQKADEQGLPGPKEALQNLASWIGNNQAACRSAFGYSDVESTAPTCSPGETSSYGPLLAGRQWSIPGTFSGGTTDISNVVITVNQASITGVHTGTPAAGCWSLADNDGDPHFIEIFPSGPLIKTD
jgi:hypothetical protein